MQTKKTFGLALSGGGARGIVHLGILQALEENNIKPSVLSGASMGAIVAIGYSLGLKPEEMLKIILDEIKPITLRNMDFKGLGLFHLHKVEKFFRSIAAEDNFSALDIPVHIVVTNLNSGTFEIKSEGKMIDFVMASASIPMLFTPKIIDGVYYVDGGLTKNMAAEVLKNQCDKVIGINVNHISEMNRFKKIKDMASRTYHLAVHNTIRDELEFCDYIVDPPQTRNFALMDFSKAQKIFDVGYEEGQQLAKLLHAEEQNNHRFVEKFLKQELFGIKKVIPYIKEKIENR